MKYHFKCCNWSLEKLICIFKNSIISVKSIFKNGIIYGKTIFYLNETVLFWEKLNWSLEKNICYL